MPKWKKVFLNVFYAVYLQKMPHTDFTDAVKPEKVCQDRKEASVATVLNDINRSSTQSDR